MKKESFKVNNENQNTLTASQTSPINTLLPENLEEEDILRFIRSYKKSVNDLQNHKILLERAESLGRMGYWEYDMKEESLWVSNGAKAIYGFDNSEMSFNDIQNMAFPEYRNKLNQILEDLIKKNVKYEMEFKAFRMIDESVIYLKLEAEYDKKNNKVHGIIQDITLQKITELELLKVQGKAEESDRLKSAFVSNMSHEIRTPMNGIVGYAHLLTDEELDLDTRKEYNESIHLCCNQLLDKVNDILDIAKIESGQVLINTSRVNLNELLSEVNDMFVTLAGTKNLELILNSASWVNNPVMLTDRVKLKKCLLILLDNAIRFTHEGYIEFGYRYSDIEIEFFVKDTGIGIDHSHHEIIFQPFTQADSKISHDFGGTGLGLSIAKTYVSMIGGKIWLESELRKGTTFFFTIPNNDISTKKIENSHTKKKFSESKICLVVEDMEMNFNYLKALLEPSGFNIIWAKDGNEAIDAAFKNDEIDLVLMDIRLPTTDGYEATRIIREKRPFLPIIAQTAYALPSEKEKALDAGCNDYITKPIYKEGFEKILKTFFDN